MQEDDTLNPGMLWVLDGEELCGAAGRRGRAGPAPTATATRAASMRGVARAIPAFDAARQRPDHARGPHPGLPARPAAGAAAGAGERGAAGAARLRRPPVARHADRRADDERLQPFRARAASCSSAARASSTCPAPTATTTSGPAARRQRRSRRRHPTGYPLYRLEWQALGSLQRRLRNCMTGVRAEPYRLRFARACRPRALPDVAGPGAADRDAGRAALTTRRQPGDPTPTRSSRPLASEAWSQRPARRRRWVSSAH